jgi:hypothetical protein
MATSMRDLQILGVYPVVPTPAELKETLEIQWGSDLKGKELDLAKEHVRDHFNRLFLIEIQTNPPSAKLNWEKITQPDATQPRSNWQVPYDEQPIEESEGRWVFFLHCVDLAQPVSTPVGQRTLPSPTPIPRHLAGIKYEVPG